jgi:hypothetical protein
MSCKERAADQACGEFEQRQDVQVSRAGWAVDGIEEPELACDSVEHLEVDCKRFNRMMRRQLRKFAQRKLAGAARFQHATGEDRAILTAKKLSTLDADAVHGDVATLRTEVRTLAKDMGTRFKRQEEVLDRIARALGTGPHPPLECSTCDLWVRASLG